jgi:hypothetical protein
MDLMVPFSKIYVVFSSMVGSDLNRILKREISSIWVHWKW